MASALNKRQQARNERTLQELIKTVPGNGTCADCSARNPGWASWSLGIFLCMRCAAIHRKLGTHISKVKSLSMDKWDNAQVDHMKRMGNTESNKTYNPRNTKPQIPIDIDEVDSAMERFIRQKYEQRAFIQDSQHSQPGTRQNTGSTSSVEDKPPPLPPKPTRRFGFGLQKPSNFPRGATPPVSPGIGGFGQDTSPPRVNKPSRVFGSNINTSGDGLDSKLTTLRDMGFADEKRNTTVLKGLNGNLDRAVEALIRLGEQNPAKSRGGTPVPPAKPPAGLNGLSFDTARTTPAAQSMNPFDALDVVATQPQQEAQAGHVQTQQVAYAGSYTQPTSPANPYNPFLPQGQQNSFQQQAFPQQQQQQQQFFAQQQSQNPYGQHQQNLDQAFQGLQLSNQLPQQALFPNRTGGYGQPQVPQTNPFHQSFTPPPMPQMPPQYSSFFPQQTQQSQYQAVMSPTSPGNPFLKSTKSQMFTPANSMNSNPFGQVQSQQQHHQQQPQPQYQAQTQQSQQNHQSLYQPQQAQPQQQQQSQYQQQQGQHQQQQQTPYQQQTANNPYMAHQNPVAQPQNPWQTQHQGYQQATPGFDKNSILALYNQPQLAPHHLEAVQSTPTTTAISAPIAPPPGNMNPFALSQTQSPQGQAATAVPRGLTAHTPGVRHVSNESVDFAGLMGGRHSPDAFSGLSSSFRR